MWPVSPAPVVSSQTILDGKPPTNKSSTQGRNTACGCVPAWLPALNFALVFKTPGIYFKKIQLMFTLRWPLALHDIIPVSCRINLPANPSFTRDNYFKKIQLLFTLRWPLALHDIIPVSCRINLPANPSFTRDNYFKKIQLLFTLRWPLALHDIIPVSCRINLPANPSFTRDIYLIL